MHSHYDHPHRPAWRVAAALGIVVAAAGQPASAKDDAAAQFYRDKQITIMVGSGPGGGYDTYARLVANHLGRFIPGNPSFIVENKTGAGSIVAMNYVANVLPKDGTVIAAVQRNVPLVELMDQAGPQFDSEKLNWIGSLANEAGACAIASRTGVKKLEDVFHREFIMGGTGPNDTQIGPAVLNNLLGARFKLIKGYTSTPPVHLAIERGEVDGICQSWSSMKEQSGDSLKNGTLKPLVQMTLKPLPELTKQGVPGVFDFVTKERVQPGYSVEDVNSYLRLVFAAKAMGRPFAMAAGVPAERVKAIRTAFERMAADPKFLADAEKQRRDVDLVTGAEIQDIVEKMAATPKDKLANLDEVITFTGPEGKAMPEAKANSAAKNK